MEICLGLFSLDFTQYALLGGSLAYYALFLSREFFCAIAGMILQSKETPG